MLSNYIIYLTTLPKGEKEEQILIIVSSLLILFILCAFLEFVKYKFLDKNKNTLFQKFLKYL